MLCVCQVYRNSLVFEVGIYVCRHICVCLCVICMPSQMMPDVFYFSDSPASWWRFAFNVVLSRVTEHTRRQTLAFVASRAQLNVRYVRAYTQKLTDPVLDADMSVSCHLCVSAASLCVPMSGASLCVPMCGASLCVLMCGEHLLACLFCSVCFHLSYLVWEGGGVVVSPPRGRGVVVVSPPCGRGVVVVSPPCGRGGGGL